MNTETVNACKRVGDGRDSVRSVTDPTGMGSGEVSAIASGVVAIAAIAAGEIRHRSSLHHARELADLESIRNVLDEAAVALHEIELSLNEIRVQLIERGAEFFEAEEGRAVYDEFARAGIHLDELLERLKIRLGPKHEAVAALREASGACVAIHHSLKLIKLEDKQSDGDIAHDTGAFFTERRESIAAERQKFDTARAEFIENAQRTAGTDLPSKPPTHAWLRSKLDRRTVDGRIP